MKNQKLATIYQAEQAIETAHALIKRKGEYEAAAKVCLSYANQEMSSGSTYSALSYINRAKDEIESMQEVRMKARQAATDALNFYYEAAYKAESNQNLNVLAYCEAMAQDVEALLEQINA